MSMQTVSSAGSSAAPFGALLRFIRACSQPPFCTGFIRLPEGIIRLPEGGKNKPEGAVKKNCGNRYRERPGFLTSPIRNAVLPLVCSTP